MCGLVAVVSKYTNGLSKEQCDIFDLLLFADQLRGMDSTGVFVVDNKDNLDLAKEASNATDFRTRKEYRDLMATALMRGSAVVGHNRAATKGVVNDANAHPFVVDDRITLMHNGTLWGDHKKLADTEVDSHAIAHTIHNNGDDVEAALKELNGAYALIWHDFKNKTLNFVRNSQRPLHWVELPGAWLWASEANMLQWMIDRFSLKPITEICMLPESILVSYQREGQGWKLAQRKLDVTPKVVYQSPTTYRGNVFNEPAEDYYYNRGRIPMQQQQPYRPSASIMQATRVESLEEDYAYKMESHFTWQEFQYATTPIKEDTYHVFKPNECSEVSITGPALGYNVYGTLEAHPDIIVKVHIPAGQMTEMELLDICINERLCLTNIKTRRWSLYKDASKREAAADGYGMYICDGLREIVSEVPQEITLGEC